MSPPPDRDQTFSLDQLVAAATSWVERVGATAADQRVSAHPDARIVRYYQSLGLVEKPLRYDGRSAVYGWRHLVQVVSVKLLQGQGYPLARVQEAFAGVPFPDLEAAALSAIGAPPTPPATAHALVAVQLQPGVNLTIDPQLVADPQALIQQLTDALKSARRTS